VLIDQLCKYWLLEMTLLNEVRLKMFIITDIFEILCLKLNVTPTNKFTQIIILKLRVKRQFKRRMGNLSKITYSCLY
jgi:Ser-tRNA(Ala) deacylase AlaX